LFRSILDDINENFLNGVINENKRNYLNSCFDCPVNCLFAVGRSYRPDSNHFTDTCCFNDGLLSVPKQRIACDESLFIDGCRWFACSCWIFWRFPCPVNSCFWFCDWLYPCFLCSSEIFRKTFELRN